MHAGPPSARGLQAVQVAFKSDFSIIDHLFVLESLADKLCIPVSVSDYIAILSTKKAFDTINKPTLWYKMFSC